MEDTDDFEFNNYAPLFKSDLLDEEVQLLKKFIQIQEVMMMIWIVKAKFIIFILL